MSDINEEQMSELQIIRLPDEGQGCEVFFGLASLEDRCVKLKNCYRLGCMSIADFSCLLNVIFEFDEQALDIFLSKIESIAIFKNLALFYRGCQTVKLSKKETLFFKGKLEVIAKKIFDVKNRQKKTLKMQLMFLNIGKTLLERYDMRDPDGYFDMSQFPRLIRIMEDKYSIKTRFYWKIETLFNLGNVLFFVEVLFETEDVKVFCKHKAKDMSFYYDKKNQINSFFEQRSTKYEIFADMLSAIEKEGGKNVSVIWKK